jgi:amylosucrase
MNPEAILVVTNFAATPSYLDLEQLRTGGMFRFGHLKDLLTGESPAVFNGRLVIPPFHIYWLTDQNPTPGY